MGAGALVVALPAGFTFVDGLSGCGSNACPGAGKLVVSGASLTFTSSCNSDHTHDVTLMTSELSAPPSGGVTRDTSVDPIDDHLHTVSLTSAELAQIEAGATVAKTTDQVNGHIHTFAFRKA